MKKTMAFLLAVVMIFGCVACGSGNENNTQPSSETESNIDNENSQEAESSEMETQPPVELHIVDANEILTKVWENYNENEKFPVVGGHYSAYVDGAPAKYDITQIADMEKVFCIPAETIAMVDDAASLQYAMNVNKFSAMACHLKLEADMQIVIDSIKNATMNNQWIYGHPDRLIILTIGDEYFVTAFGDGEKIDAFLFKVLNAYENLAELVVDQDL
ncbi:MAG: hypothetical protein ACI4TK_00935 [Agathobacter sp.]